MFPNAKASEQLSILATLDPGNQAVGVANTGWVPLSTHHGLLALVQTGALATGATVDAKLQQAQDAITPVFGQIWPVALPQIGAVSVTFDAGYGSAADVPEGLKSWIKLRLGSLYAHREEVASLARGRIVPSPYADGLLDPF